MAQRIVPMLAYEDAAAAIDWLTAAFGFTERAEQRHTATDGTIGHAELELGGDVIRSPEDAPRAGMRLYTVEDPEGHRWLFGQPL